MSRDNLIQIEAHRRAKQAGSRRDLAHRDRGREPDALLERLRSTKRLLKNDQRTIVCNIGHLVERLDPHKKLLIAEEILRPEQWAKRKRYILFPDEAMDEDARVAAAGGTFAGIVDALIKLRTSRGFDPAQARITTVHEILERTSFRPASQLTIGNNGEDAALFIHQMDAVLKRFAREAQLGEYFELISKYSVAPIDDWPRTDLVAFEPAHAPQNLFVWDDVTDDYELEFWIPWWAPKCVIGHLYIPFQTNLFSCAKDQLSTIRDSNIGELNKTTWVDDKWWDWVDELVKPELIRPEQTIYHRLPLWLMALPIENGFVWCLFASVSYRDNFQVSLSLHSDDDYYSYDDAITPVFVGSVGSKLGDDGVYFCEDTYDEFTRYYVALAGNKVRVIGSGLDDEIRNFRAEFYGPWLSEDDLPPWLAEYPVQRFLKLTGNTVPAKNLALTLRRFTNFNSRYQTREFDSLFRPAFFDPIEMPVPFASNSIAAYLMRNFTYATDGGIFDALKRDAVSKAKATRAAVNSKLSKFHEAFRDRFDE
ncbi:hypothetical protein [Bradyrhizobium elkanii]|uniref:hypothetical protein n=1 Tax=Bradyrhizobium elkanii TaxID=29448 RepID=UPI00209EB370|nr:hypothetical protein [Bradyrhizobium elkanii]MCP1974285.1 hypothetical protein [Bradyrhizobium elkanii]MCS4104210.1 hypothetical protein [Bradyrhizobium elkanii]